MSIRTFLIVVVAILFIFDTEGGKISGRIGSGARVFSGRSTFRQTGSNSRKIGRILPLSGYYKESVSRSNDNPTSEFAFWTSLMQSRYPSMNILPYSLSAGTDEEEMRLFNHKIAQFERARKMYELMKSEQLSNQLLVLIRLLVILPSTNEETIRQLNEYFEQFERQMEMQSKLSSEYSSEHEPVPSTSTETDASSSSNSSNTQQSDNLSQQNYSDDEVKKLSESLFDMDKNNAYKYITVNLQNETKEHCTVDNAPLPLLDIKSEAYEISTIKNLRALYENSIINKNKTEELLNKYLETDVFKMTMKFLVEKNLISSNKYKFKNTLRRICFLNQYLKNFELFEYRNWIYFAKQEEQKKIDYRGYIKNIKLADKGEAIKLCFNIRDIGHSVTILLGLSPELEMALYTACYHLRPRNNCTISLGGKDINLVPHKIFYYTYDKQI